METILTGNIWRQVAKQAKTAKRRLVAVAYVSSARYLRLHRNDVLVCDASNRAIQTRETSAHLLEALFRKGVELRSRPDLHAKVAVFGRYALIGSCNISASSEEDLTELALLTDRQQIVAQTLAFIHGLREDSQAIDEDFLRRILKLKVHPVRGRGHPRKGRTARFGNRVWLVSVGELAEDAFPSEQPFVEAGYKKAGALVADGDSTISWIRWTGKDRFRSVAQPGDRVIQIWKPLFGKHKTVFAPCPLVLRQDIGHWSRFYVAEPEHCHSLSWKRFEKEANKHGLSRITENSVRELTPREVLLVEQLWK